MDAFQAAIEEDKSKGRTPLMCVANVHSTIFQKQSVAQLQVLKMIITFNSHVQ